MTSDIIPPPLETRETLGLFSALWDVFEALNWTCGISFSVSEAAASRAVNQCFFCRGSQPAARCLRVELMCPLALVNKYQGNWVPMAFMTPRHKGLPRSYMCTDCRRRHFPKDLNVCASAVSASTRSDGVLHCCIEGEQGFKFPCDVMGPKTLLRKYNRQEKLRCQVPFADLSWRICQFRLEAVVGRVGLTDE